MFSNCPGWPVAVVTTPSGHRTVTRADDAEAGRGQAEVARQRGGHRLHFDAGPGLGQLRQRRAQAVRVEVGADTARAARAAGTKVEFFTLVRGEDQ